MSQTSAGTAEVAISIGTVEVRGNLTLPDGAAGIVAFAHGSGSGRHSPRNRFVAEELHQVQLATLLVDLLTPQEDEIDRQTGELRFDIALLTERVLASVDWLRKSDATQGLPIGLFGASTGAAAALKAAAERPEEIAAVVSRGGRPDLAADALARVGAPTLLIVGGNDPVVLGLNRGAFEALQVEKQLEIVPGAGHLFEEPGALDQVASLAVRWFQRHLAGAG
jgi:dienelactone hydrolase